jgi:histidyl-tRNA synthetase
MVSNISTQDFVRSASRTAQHYGFSSVDTLKENPACKECSEKITHTASAQDRKEDSLHGILTAGMTAYFENKLNAIPGPSLFYTIDKVPRSGDIAVSFHIINVQKSIAEALLIQTVRSLLNDIGQENSVVRINSLGDADSLTRYTRDLTNYLRKRLDDMPPTARELMKEHACSAFMHLVEKEHELCAKSPSPLEYLSDVSRKHFREIVEYLDMTQTPFEIDPRLIGHHECYSDALFAFDILDEDGVRLGENAPLTARGGRYDAFVSRMTKEKVPAVGAVLILKDKKAPAQIAFPRNKKVPSVYLAQLGFGPKVRSLLLIEELRKAGIRVNQNVTSDSLTEQLRKAEATGAEYAVILGHKEFMENTVIIRNLHEQNQENISLGSLVSYLKKVAV